MTEWTKVPVLKTGVVQATVGSNPTPSAEHLLNVLNKVIWGGARVADWGRLLSGCRVNNSTAGSNPALPALRKSFS